MSQVVFKALKKLVSKIANRNPTHCVPVIPTFEKKITARVEAGMFIVTLEETAPDMFTVLTRGKVSGSISGCYRHGKARAIREFNSTVGLCGGKDFIK